MVLDFRIGQDGKFSASGDQRAHPEAEQRDDQSSPSRGGDTMQLKEADEAHPELKQSNFMAKLKPLGFAKKPQVTRVFC
uniref:Uncharacterized protein n=1 Tax=Parascaris equorum TaxID=6256 RepID=A0A914R3H0_PAREQ